MDMLVVFMPIIIGLGVNCEFVCLCEYIRLCHKLTRISVQPVRLKRIHDPSIFHINCVQSLYRWAFMLSTDQHIYTIWTQRKAAENHLNRTWTWLLLCVVYNVGQVPVLLR